MRASRAFVCILIRRPHAYAVSAAYDRAPIPGLTVLDGDGKRVGAVGLGGDPEPRRVAEALESASK